MDISLNSIFSIILICFAIIVASYSIGINGKIGDLESERKYRVFSRIYLFSIASYCFLPLVVDGSMSQIVLMVIAWFSFSATLAVITAIVAYTTGLESKWISANVSVFCYLALFTVFFELVFGKYQIVHNRTGYGFIPGHKPFFLLYYFEIILFLICMFTLIVNYALVKKSPRDRYVLKYTLFAIIPAVLCLILEVVLVHFGIYFPFFRIATIIPLFVERQILIIVRKQRICIDDYENELNPARTSPILICEDSHRVKFVNKAASVLASMENQVFEERRLEDIFLIDAEELKLLSEKSNKTTFSITAIYLITNQCVKLSVKHTFDCVGEILSSVITVVDFESIASDGSDSISNLISIVGSEETHGLKLSLDNIRNEMDIVKGSHILVVSENSSELDLFRKILTPYSIELVTALGGNAAIDLLQEPQFDIIIISYEMTLLSGIDTARMIRSMEGEYYSVVPIIFSISGKMDDIFRGLLDVNFNDYITRPISSMQLNLVLTRWLWKRYRKSPDKVIDSEIENVEETNEVFSLYDKKKGYFETLRSLIEESHSSFIAHEWALLGCTMNGIKRISMLLDEKELIYDSSEISDMIIMGDYVSVGRAFSELCVKANELFKKNDVNVVTFDSSDFKQSKLERFFLGVHD